MATPTPPLLLFILILLPYTHPQPTTTSDDITIMQELKKTLNPPNSLNWLNPNPCKWTGVQCSPENRITRIQIGGKSLSGGPLPPSLSKLESLVVFEVMNNKISGPVPNFAGISSLERVLVNNNNFSSVPISFFEGLKGLQSVYFDYNPFEGWEIDGSLRDCGSLKEFSANGANLIGKIPDFLNSEAFPSLEKVHLAGNDLVGELPSSFGGSSIQSLWLNGQKRKLNGSLYVLQNSTGLKEVWLHGNSFSGPLFDFSGFVDLVDFSVRDNSITGPVPDSLLKLETLTVVNLTDNLLQGSTPEFGSSVRVDMREDSNRFCLSDIGVSCDSRVDVLLDVVKYMGYPRVFAENWKGNDPCKAGENWKGISCNSKGEVIVINFRNMGLSGSISPNFSQLIALESLYLTNNMLTGVVPNELTTLPNLKSLDLSNNNIYGKVPLFRSNVRVNTDGNVNIGKDGPPPGTPVLTVGGSPTSSGGGGGSPQNGGKKSSTGVIVGSVIGGLGAAVVIAGLLVFCLRRTKHKRSSRVQGQTTTMMIHPRHSSSDQDAVKITISGPNANVNGQPSETHSLGNSGSRDLQIVEAGNLVISIQVLRNVTNNFSEDNILGKGGFGTVYKGELHDGTKIAVKRMESGVMSEKGLDEFTSEIAVLTKVRHRHLVALLGYCLDGNERLLVYEYMPQGTLSSHVFNWKEEGLTPLEWTKRVIIALDVARGVEYLHTLAQQSFIHRDLKPSNILLGDDMHAKVADFGLVRLAPNGKASLVTRLAGTFGYLAPEYAVTGRVTTKIDVFSFGVILMEMITGRKTLDETQPEDSIHLVPWFRRMHVNKDTFREIIDPTINLDVETLASVNTVAELAGHCTAREPYQRPDMGHAVNVLSSLAEVWKPSEPDLDDAYGIDYDMTLPQALKKWKALEGMSGIGNSSSFLGSNDNSQTSIPTRPFGFADSFTSTDGR
ncbi:hypothetical protein LIER_02565 [Lithospermum erythrorhizon]|uniref:non-specific serine/threonine protein kinase n=1 Tax=Lithospermum erythrorhizon TaxID=34254 RepID=A0AAV3NR59_LITER